MSAIRGGMNDFADSYDLSRLPEPPGEVPQREEDGLPKP